jgi:pimeloyl-ACP methyl ester carboxylesterase
MAMTVVILVPGILTPGRIRFAPLVAAIGSADCEVKELEVYAGSQVPDDYSLQMEVDGLDRFASERGLERFHLYGFSIGGSIALAYVAEHGSRVASLALDEPATDFTDDDRKAMAAEGTDRLADLPPGERMKLFMQTMTRPGVNLAPPPSQPTGPEMALRPAGLAAVSLPVRDYAIDEPKLRAYTGPVYFSYGGLSNARWEAMATRMRTCFPRCVVERYNDRHHLDASHQAEPERVATALRTLWGQT